MVKRFNLYKESRFSVLSELQAFFLAPNQMKYIATKETPKDKLLHEFTTGNRCLGLVEKGEVLSYIWINTKYLQHYGIKKPLMSNECCFYNAMTKPELRGNGYAGILRAKCYEILSKQGIDTFYSFTDLNNKPAMRFKEKIAAEKIATYKYIKFWKFESLKDEKL